MHGDLIRASKQLNKRLTMQTSWTNTKDINLKQINNRSNTERIYHKGESIEVKNGNWIIDLDLDYIMS